MLRRSQRLVPVSLKNTVLALTMMERTKSIGRFIDRGFLFLTDSFCGLPWTGRTSDPLLSESPIPQDQQGWPICESPKAAQLRFDGIDSPSAGSFKSVRVPRYKTYINYQLH